MISGQPITHRAVWSMAGPIILANLSVPLVGAVDTAVVGHLPGPEYIGAVALGALIFSFLYWGFGFLRMGTTGFVARALGAADHAAMERLILRVLLLALVFGLLVLVLGRPVVALALWLIEGTAEVERLAGTYSHIRLWSAPATLCIYVCTGVFIGLKNTRYVLTLQLVLNLTNVLLDLIFVPWLGFGVEGVAWATLIAEYLAAGLGLWMLRPWLRRALDRPELGRRAGPRADGGTHEKQRPPAGPHPLPGVRILVVHRAKRHPGGTGPCRQQHPAAPADLHGLRPRRIRPRGGVPDRGGQRRPEPQALPSCRAHDHPLGRHRGTGCCRHLPGSGTLAADPVQRSGAGAGGGGEVPSLG